MGQLFFLCCARFFLALVVDVLNLTSICCRAARQRGGCKRALRVLQVRRRARCAAAQHLSSSGGVSSPISAATTATMPNQTRLSPSASISGASSRLLWPGTRISTASDARPTEACTRHALLPSCQATSRPQRAARHRLQAARDQAACYRLQVTRHTHAARRRRASNCLSCGAVRG